MILLLTGCHLGYPQVVRGFFAMVWGLLRTGIVIAELNKGRLRLYGNCYQFF